MFSSATTGTVPVDGILGDTPYPFRAKHLTLELVRSSDLRTFAHLKNSGRTLKSATIVDDADGMRYALRGIVVTNNRSEPAFKPWYPHGRAWVTLKVQQLTLKCGPPTCPDRRR